MIGEGLYFSIPLDINMHVSERKWDLMASPELSIVDGTPSAIRSRAALNMIRSCHNAFSLHRLAGESGPKVILYSKVGI